MAPTLHVALTCRQAIAAKKAATLLGCDLSRVYKLLGAGALQGYRDGRAVRVFLDSIAAYQTQDPIAPLSPARQQRREPAPVAAAHHDAIARLQARGVL